MILAGMFARQQVAVGGGSFGISDAVYSNSPSNNATHPVSMPASVASGDLLVVAIAHDGNPTLGTPSGWTKVADDYDPTMTGHRHGLFKKTADGSEGGTTVDFTTTGGSTRSVSMCARLPGGTDVERTTATINNLSNAPIPSFNPTWAAQDTGWIVFVSGFGNGTVSSWPLPDNQHRNSLSSSFTVYAATKTENIETQAPANLVMSSGLYGFVYVVAVRGP